MRGRRLGRRGCVNDEHEGALGGGAIRNGNAGGAGG